MRGVLQFSYLLDYRNFNKMETTRTKNAPVEHEMRGCTRFLHHKSDTVHLKFHWK